MVFSRSQLVCKAVAVRDKIGNGTENIIVSAVLSRMELIVRNVSYAEPLFLPRLIVNEPFILKVHSLEEVIGIR